MKRKQTGMERSQGGHQYSLSSWGGPAPPGGKRGSPGLYLLMCAPVVAGSILILSTSQRWVDPGRRILQAEGGLLGNVWLCEGKDVTSNSEV